MSTKKMRPGSTEALAAWEDEADRTLMVVEDVAFGALQEDADQTLGVVEAEALDFIDRMFPEPEQDDTRRMFSAPLTGEEPTVWLDGNLIGCRSLAAHMLRVGFENTTDEQIQNQIAHRVAHQSGPLGQAGGNAITTISGDQ